MKKETYHQLPKPPYWAESEAIILQYEIKTEKIKGIIPTKIKIEPRANFYIFFFNYSKVLSADKIECNYNEVMYSIDAIFQENRVIFPLKLYLNSELSVKFGRAYYGMPKDYADVSYKMNEDKVKIEATENLQNVFELDARIETSLLSKIRLMIEEGFIRKQIANKTLLFLKDNQVILSKLNPIVGDIRFCRVDKIYSTDLDEWEIPYKNPKNSLYFKSFNFELSEPIIGR